VITDWAGEPLGLKSDGRVVAAATPALHAAALEALA
jgi:fructose-1,6-bisphosphatase/inositol monophosphatase family enzyme